MPKNVHTKVPFLASLRGADRKTLDKGLIEYRSVRSRVRDLRKSSTASTFVKPLVKTKSFIVEKIEFQSPTNSAPKPKVLIVGGVHPGSETVGVESAVRLAEYFAKSPQILDHFDITVVPLVNPTGLLRTSPTKSKNGTPGRYSNDGKDLNRTFLAGKFTPESKAMADLIQTGGFHAVLDLHGAGSQRDGFFLIRGADDGGLASRSANAASGVPLLSAKSAGKTYAFESPGVVTSTNPGTLKQFAVAAGTHRSYTFEAPGSLSAKEQVKGTTALVHSTLANLRAELSQATH